MALRFPTRGDVLTIGVAFAIYFGVNPNALLKYMQPSVDQTVVQLADWTKANEPAKLQRQAAPATADRPAAPWS